MGRLIPRLSSEQFSGSERSSPLKAAPARYPGRSDLLGEKGLAEWLRGRGWGRAKPRRSRSPAATVPSAVRSSELADHLVDAVLGAGGAVHDGTGAATRGHRTRESG